MVKKMKKKDKKGSIFYIISLLAQGVFSHTRKTPAEALLIGRATTTSQTRAHQPDQDAEGDTAKAK